MRIATVCASGSPRLLPLSLDVAELECISRLPTTRAEFATDPGDTYRGWERLVQTWCLDWVSTYEVYWNVPDDTLDISKLPHRAFDSAEQYAETAKLAADYNSHDHDLTPQINSRFEQLAQQRIAADPCVITICRWAA